MKQSPLFTIAQERYTPISPVLDLKVFQDAWPLLDAANQAQTVGDIEALFERFAAHYGLRFIGQLWSRQASGDDWQALQLSYRGEELNRQYITNKIFTIDPAVQRAMKENSPIPWGLKYQRGHLSVLEKRFYGFHDDLNNGHGLISPIHGSDYISIMGITNDGSEADFVQRLPQFGAVMQLFTVYVTESLLRLQAVNQAVTEQYRLTPRERECLTWSAAGKVAWEIADILGVAETTVIKHIENAKRKLQAKTLPQAVARAVSHGLIQL